MVGSISDANLNASQDGQSHKRRRIRIPKSCIPCLKGKRACDRERPACGRCARSGQPGDCVYDSRLDAKAAPSGGRKVKPPPISGSSPDASEDDRHNSDEVAALRAELEAARREARELKQLVQRQQHYGALPPPSSQQQQERHSSCAGPTPSTGDRLPSRKRSNSRRSDLDAVSGLQMLAEMAGPVSGDTKSDGASGSASTSANSSNSLLARSGRPEAARAADSAAFYDRSRMSSIASVLNWPEAGVGRAARAGLRQGRSEPHSAGWMPHSGDAIDAGLAMPSSSDPGLSPSSDTRSQASTAQSSLQSPPAPAAESIVKDNASPVNRNGMPIYYGESASGDVVLRQVKAEHAADPFAVRNPSLQLGAGGRYGAMIAAESQANAIKRDVQTAFNGLLDPSHDMLPFATIWSSGDAFFDEVLPLFPTPDEFDAICQSFVRHFSAMCPALTVPSAIEHAREFSRLSREQQAGVPLPWLAVFLTICAMGINCDLENTMGSSNRPDRRRHINSLLRGGGASGGVGVDPCSGSNVSARPSRSPSPASSPEPLQDAIEAARAPRVSTAGKARPAGLYSDLYLSATYQALRLCSFLSSPTLQTIHAQLLIGSYLLNTERAASFWPLLGSIARQAQSIGLHVDPNRIRSDWNPIEADIRRRLWWAIVHQDVILSGIFGRPLGITRFSTGFPASPVPTERSFASLQCELSQFARTCLDENQDDSWSQQQIQDFTGKLESWYVNIPRRFRTDLGFSVDPFGSTGEEEAIRNYQMAGVDLNVKGLMEIHQSCNLAIEVHYVLLSLHRSNLLRTDDADAEGASAVHRKAGDGDDGDRVNEASLAACTRCVREIARAQQIMTELLGRARASMFWKVSYYTYQAAVVGAYITFLRPQSSCAASALEDLGRLTDIFDRMPDRWTGLKVAKGGLRVLHTLAVAARENPQAASMPRAAQASQPAAVLTPLPIMNEFDPFGTSSFAGLLGSTGLAPAAINTTPMFVGGGGPSSASVGRGSLAGATVDLPSRHQQHPQLHAHLASGSTPFTQPVYQNSPSRGRFDAPMAFGQGYGAGASDGASQYDLGFRTTSFSIEQYLSDAPPQTGGGAASGTSDASQADGYPFNPPVNPPRQSRRGSGPHGETPGNGQQSHEVKYSRPSRYVGEDLATATATAAAAAVPAASDGGRPLATSSHGASTLMAAGPITDRSGTYNAAGVGAPQYPLGTTSTQGTPAWSQAPAYTGGGGGVGMGELNGHAIMGGAVPTPNPNLKDLANYWSDYFSLQLDWDRLSALT
ncbi:hypothetical protein ACQY0O_000677 [Thecaphora frezii]